MSSSQGPQLNEAAPEVWVELNPADATPLGIAEGDTVIVESRRGVVHAPARLRDIRPGTVFLPFHYGYWDAGDDGHYRAANELTLTDWDPASKQPLFKVAAVRVSKAG